MVVDNSRPALHLGNRPVHTVALSVVQHEHGLLVLVVGKVSIAVLVAGCLEEPCSNEVAGSIVGGQSHVLRHGQGDGIAALAIAPMGKGEERIVGGGQRDTLSFFEHHLAVHHGGSGRETDHGGIGTAINSKLQLISIHCLVVGGDVGRFVGDEISVLVFLAKDIILVVGPVQKLIAEIAHLGQHDTVASLEGGAFGLYADTAGTFRLHVEHWCILCGSNSLTADSSLDDDIGQAHLFALAEIIDIDAQATGSG